MTQTPLELAAFPRELTRADRRAAIDAWGAFADLKSLLAALFAGSTLALDGRLRLPEYRLLLEQVLAGTDGVVRRLRTIRFRSDDERAALGSALRTFARELKKELHAPPGEQVDTMAAAARMYAAGRALAQRFWALELRPEGLGPTAEALERYRPLDEP